MRENLSARGTLDDWMDASEEALWNTGFERVEIDEHFDRIAADIGQNGYLDINFLVQEDGRVRLELDASEQQLLDRFKSSVTQIMKNGGTAQPRSHNHYDETPENYDDDDDAYEETDYSRQSKPKKRGRSRGNGFKLPQGSRSSGPFFSKTWFVLLMLIIIPPLGIFLMYYYKKLGVFPRVLLTILAVLYTLLIWLGFFGINTGVNQESINQWTKGAQSQITRFINEHKPASSSPTATPTVTVSPTPSPSAKSNTDSTTTDDNTTTNTDDSTDNPIKNIINSLIPQGDE